MHCHVCLVSLSSSGFSVCFCREVHTLARFLLLAPWSLFGVSMFRPRPPSLQDRDDDDRRAVRPLRRDAEARSPLQLMRRQSFADSDDDARAEPAPARRYLHRPEPDDRAYLADDPQRRYIPRARAAAAPPPDYVQATLGRSRVQGATMRHSMVRMDERSFKAHMQFIRGWTVAEAETKWREVARHPQNFRTKMVRGELHVWVPQLREVATWDMFDSAVRNDEERIPDRAQADSIFARCDLSSSSNTAIVGGPASLAADADTLLQRPTGSIGVALPTTPVDTRPAPALTPRRFEPPPALATQGSVRKVSD